MTDALMSMHGIRKAFGPVNALQGVNFNVYAGEVHALLGENGAGKSTLIKIMMGVYRKDGGEIVIEGKPQELGSPSASQDLGLAAVYQDVTLAAHLSVGENFFLGRLPIRHGLVNWSEVYSVSEAFLRSLDIDVDVRARISDLTIAKQQLVAIAKVVWTGARLMIFDEPTALLTTGETEKLFQLIRRLRADGRAVIYVSHRMEEIFEICDRATVLRDGQFVNTLMVRDTTPDGLVAMMVGRAVQKTAIRPSTASDEVMLEVHKLSAHGRFSDISFELAKGEILGFYGLVGAGRTEVMRAIFGADRYDSGRIVLNGKVIRPSSPSQMIKRGFGLIPEDRKNQALAMPMSVSDNVSMIGGRRSTLGWLHRGAERKLARDYVSRLRIKTPSIDGEVARLSGGNQQKVVVAKWLSVSPKIVVFDEPTIGVDVASRAEIHMLIRELADNGRGVIVISSYLPEILELADRIVVMHEGRQVGICDREDASEERLLGMASRVIAATDQRGELLS